MIREAKHSDINIINELGEKLLNNFSKTYDIISYINNKDYIFLVNQDKEINAFLLVRKNLNDFELEYIIVKDKKIPHNDHKAVLEIIKEHKHINV